MKKILMICFLCLSLLGLVSCGSAENATKENNDSIYYLNTEASKLVAAEYALKPTDTNEQIEWVYQGVLAEQASETRIPLLPEGVTMNSWRLEGDILWVDFSANYASMEPAREVLVRAGIVRSFSNVPKVGSVGFLIEGEELNDSKGDPVGAMKAIDFVENSGKEVNAYQYVTMKLYFANKTGDKLVLEERKVYYSKNIPLERAVVEQLLEGPRVEGNYPTIPIETKILSVSAMEGLGYVNLDQGFLHDTLPVTEEVTIQSIIRSVAEACNVSKIQISINGETKVDFHDKISFDQFFEVNDSLLEGI